MTRFLSDLRVAARGLVRARGFTVIAVLILGLGIGANAAIFSLIRAVLLEPFPYGHPDGVVMIWNAADRGGTTWLSVQELDSYRRDVPSLAEVSGYIEADANLTDESDPERVAAALVTPDVFSTLQASPLAGRVFGADDGRPGADDVVMIGHGLWRRRFGAAPNVVGQVIPVNGRARTIVGVMPPSFRLPRDYRHDRPTELWTPLVIDPAKVGAWGDRSLIVVGRTQSNVSAATVTRELAVVARRWIAAGFVADSGDGALFRTAIPVHDFVTGDIRPTLLMLFGAVGFVLLIACANVVNLLLARADVRSREVAVRTALGASRGQIVRQLLFESVLLSSGGGLLGVLMASAGLRALTSLGPAGLPRANDVGIDAGMLAFSLMLAVTTGVLFGLAPALKLSRPNLTSGLNDGGRCGTAGRARRTLGKGLIVAQMACSVVLVLGAGLLVRSLLALQRVEPGFDSRGILTADVQLPATSYPQPGDVVRFYRALEERLRGYTGVEHVGAVRILPLTRTMGNWSITIEGRPFVPAENPNADYQAVTPGYFAAMSMTLVRGRWIDQTDRERMPIVAVVSEAMAERYWPGEDALGKRFHMGTLNQPWVTIVGIARSVRHNAIVEAPRAEMYLAHAQLPEEVGAAPRAMTIVIRTSSRPEGMAGPLREAVGQLDRRLPVANLRTMDDVVASALSRPRFTTVLLTACAGLALTLAAIGIYGMISLLVTDRAREIGVRMALGASRGTIMSMMLGQSLWLTVFGLVAGIIGAIGLTRVLTGFVYGVTTLDPLTFTLVPGLLALVAVLAALAPARRAARLDPVTTLRQS